MKTVRNTPVLRAWLARPTHNGHLDHLLDRGSFEFDDDSFEAQCAELHARHAGMPPPQVEMRAAFHLLAHGHKGRLDILARVKREIPWLKYAAIAAVVLGLILLGIIAAKASPEPEPGNAAQIDRVLAGIRLPMPLGATGGGNGFCQFLTSPPTLSNGNFLVTQCDKNGNALVTFGGSLPAGANLIGAVEESDGTNTQLVDPCASVAKSYLPISEAASSSAKIITGTLGKHTYICSILIVSAAAINFNFLSGTGTNCGTINGSYFGTNTASAAAANGPNLAANGGFTLGNGASGIARDNAAGDDTCWIASGTTQVSGVVSYVQR